MRSTTLMLSLLAAAFAVRVAAAAADESAPNILYIFTDDQSYQSIKDNGGSAFVDYLPPPKTRDTPLVGKPSGDTTVYYVEGKRRVHVEGCRRLTTDPKILATMIKMTLAEAEAKGLPLCSRCPGSATRGKGNP